MSNFLKRTLSGALFVLIIIGSIILGRYSFFVLFLTVTIASLYEFYRMSFKARIRPQYLYGIVLGAVIFVTNYLYASGQIGHYIFLGLIPLIFSIFIVELFRSHPRPMHNVAYTILGLLYVAFPISLLNYFALSYSSYRVGFRTDLLLGFFTLIWANDTGAYLVGTSIGKHKLFPSVSPKKSWEGLIGGFVSTLLAAWIISLFYHDISLLHWLTIGMITATMSVFGDLVESLFKRSIGVKDSGKFLPGHGGFLDRFDSLLLAVPVLFVYFEIMMII